MIPFEKAFDAVAAHARPMKQERRPLDACLGMVLSANVRAAGAMPPFDSSSVDGFALRADDAERLNEEGSIELVIQATVRAGDRGDVPLKKGHAFRINTGAPVHRSVHAVIMKEWAVEAGKRVRLDGSARRGGNIRRKGGEYRSGAVVARRDDVVTPAMAGLLASAGCARPAVYGKPRVALLVTGSELRPVAARLRPGQIYESVSHSLIAALRAINLESIELRRAKDDPAAIRRTIRGLLARCDILLTAGGVSVGEHDFVKDAFAACGVGKIFWRVAIKPGKPLFFGTKKGTLVFGLPGNPVSALVSFQMLVRPALLRMLGFADVRPVATEAVLEEDLTKPDERLEFVRCALAKGDDGILRAAPVQGQESHMLGGLAGAHGLLIFPAASRRLKKGARVRVALFDWGMM